MSKFGAQQSTLPFENLHELLKLDISSNKLTIISSDAFVGLHNLKRLMLEDNRLNDGSLYQFAFENLHELLELDISSNKLTIISSDAFVGLHNLKRLILEDNRLNNNYMSKSSTNNLYFKAGHTGKEAAKLALEYVSRIEKNPCTGGTEETLDLTFNHTAWEKYTQPAILTSNFLSSVILKNNGSLDSLTDEMFFSLVRNNVNSLKNVFGSCIAIEPGIYSNYSSFAPYAYRQNEIVFSHDIALSYKYHGNKTEWYFNLKIRNWENATRTVFKTKYSAGDISLPEQEIVVLTAKLEDGHWTKPYFDCGGGDIWMVTFSSPILSLDLTERPKFQGIASVDIQLTNIDINQCDQDSTHIYSDIDIFRGTHRCPPTTECKFIKGRGFQRGAYECVCSKGYYFPDLNAQVKAFSGLEMENSSDSTLYTCLPCKVGCSECDDDSPCLYEYLFLYRFLLLLLTLLTFIAIGVLFAITVNFRDKPVIKAGSPIFLLLMCAGGLLVCTMGFLAYPKPSEFLCASQTWVFHIGFSLMYGALVAKTWRHVLLTC
ncbi:probable G-protein coupled receptor 158 [Mytilus californianus]|uniref:probable G-protein coupled receptor 158 n=1 Tax=Mytilus californianus TaxID=6549 RepID=UPI0022452C79|nr:probable G-protein coupled receptor 158 [Mytilus californianus]